MTSDNGRAQLYPCVDPAFAAQIDAEEYASQVGSGQWRTGVYRCLDGHFHAEFLEGV